MRKPQARKAGLALAVGRQIAQRRLAAGLTQAALAESISVEAETISRLERGAVLPSLLTLDKLATVLNVGIGELLGAASLQPSDHRAQLERLLAGLNDEERLFLMDLIQRQVGFMRRSRS